MNTTDEFTPAQKKELKVLIAFVRHYCGACHTGQEQVSPHAGLAGVHPPGLSLCPACRDLLGYAVTRRRLCPLDPKPTCKKCHIHCFGREYRARIREIMAFSGRRMIMRGRLDYLWHYLF